MIGVNVRFTEIRAGGARFITEFIFIKAGFKDVFTFRERERFNSESFTSGAEIGVFKRGSRTSLI